MHDASTSPPVLRYIFASHALTLVCVHVQAARLLGRVPVMPVISCRSPFLRGDHPTTWFRDIPISFAQLHQLVLPVDDDMFPAESEMCSVVASVPIECQAMVRCVLTTPFLV